MTTFNPYRQLAQDLRGIEREARNHNVKWARRRLCWKCQQEKNSRGGSQKVLGGVGGLLRFICSDCKPKQSPEAQP